MTRVKFSPGWKDQPHWHPDEVRKVAVLSGTFYFGSGDTWDESKFKVHSTPNPLRRRTSHERKTVR